MPGPLLARSGRLPIDPVRVREIIGGVRWSLKRKPAFVRWGDLTHTGIIISLPTLVSPHWHFPLVLYPPPPSPPPSALPLPYLLFSFLTGGISSVNPCRNVALAMERMPSVYPAGPVASKRTAACRSASPAWTVLSSTASRRPTAPAPAMLPVVTAWQGESG